LTNHGFFVRILSIMIEKERKGPCLDKKCSECCNPVKVGRFFPEDKIPKDKDGQPLWAKR